MEGPESPNREILSCVLIVGRRHLWNAGHRHNTREGLDEEGGGETEVLGTIIYGTREL